MLWEPLPGFNWTVRSGHPGLLAWAGALLPNGTGSAWQRGSGPRTATKRPSRKPLLHTRRDILASRPRPARVCRCTSRGSRTRCRQLQQSGRSLAGRHLPPSVQFTSESLIYHDSPQVDPFDRPHGVMSSEACLEYAFMLSPAWHRRAKHGIDAVPPCRLPAGRGIDGTLVHPQCVDNRSFMALR